MRRLRKAFLRLMSSNFYESFRHERAAAKIGHCSGDVNDIQRRTRFVKKGHN